jgi:hypothetical protein
MLPLEYTSDLERFRETFRRYAELSPRGLADAIERKMRSLGIRLYGLFRERQWGGGARRRGIARAELDARAAQGRGIHVRASLRAEADAQRRNIGVLAGGLQARRAAGAAGEGDRRQARSLQRAGANLWRQIVGRELRARERGIGVLAASFLWYRRRDRRGEGPTFVRNRRGEPLGWAEREGDVGRIIAETPAVARIGDRYGIVQAALQAEDADTRDYIRRRFLGIFDEARQGVAR